MTLYSILVRILRIINHLYFVEVRSVGRTRMPDTGPVLLAANHPRSILGSVLMSATLARQFMALHKRFSETSFTS